MSYAGGSSSYGGGGTGRLAGLISWVVIQGYYAISISILESASNLVRALSVTLTAFEVTVSYTENHRIEGQSLTVALFWFPTTITVTNRACIFNSYSERSKDITE